MISLIFLIGVIFFKHFTFLDDNIHQSSFIILYYKK